MSIKYLYIRSDFDHLTVQIIQIILWIIEFVWFLISVKK